MPDMKLESIWERCPNISRLSICTRGKVEDIEQIFKRYRSQLMDLNISQEESPVSRGSCLVYWTPAPTCEVKFFMAAACGACRAVCCGIPAVQGAAVKYEGGQTRRARRKTCTADCAVTFPDKFAASVLRGAAHKSSGVTQRHDRVGGISISRLANVQAEVPRYTLPVRVHLWIGQARNAVKGS